MRPSDLRRAPWRDLKYALWLPLYLLFFFYLEHRPIPGYWATQLPGDALIPFCEWFILPYCLWYPFLAAVGIALLVRDHPGFRRYMACLALTFFLSGLLWLLLPSGQDLRPAVMPRDNFLTRWAAALYAIDTNTNVFPSVHVAGSLGAALAVWKSPPLHKFRAPVVVLAALICLSTLFTKQHAVLDAVGGMLMALAVGMPLYHTKKSRYPQ